MSIFQNMVNYFKLTRALYTIKSKNINQYVYLKIYASE